MSIPRRTPSKSPVASPSFKTSTSLSRSPTPSSTRRRQSSARASVSSLGYDIQASPSPRPRHNTLSPISAYRRTERSVSVGSADNPIVIGDGDDEEDPNDNDEGRENKAINDKDDEGEGKSEDGYHSDMDYEPNEPDELIEPAADIATSAGRNAASEPPESTPIKRPISLERSPASAPPGLGSPPSAKRPKKSTQFKKKTPSAVDESLQELIEKGPVKSISNARVGEGYNYTFSVPTKSHETILVKVGQTKRSVETRKKEIEYRCGYEYTESFHISRPRIRHYKMAEALIKAELHNLRHEADCSCPERHTEYFKVDKDLVSEISNRWIDFCDFDEVWDEHGQLAQFWQQRLHSRLRCEQDEKEDDHDKRIERWQQFVNYTKWDFRLYLAERIIASLPGPWQCATLLHAIFVAYVLFPNPWCMADLLFVFVILYFQTEWRGSLSPRKHSRRLGKSTPNAQKPQILRDKSIKDENHDQDQDNPSEEDDDQGNDEASIMSHIGAYQ